MKPSGCLIAVLLAGGLMVPLSGASAGGGGGGGPCAAFRSGSTMVMRDNCFDGVAHFAAAGTTLVVENQGALPHSLTAVDGSFDTGVLQPGEGSEIELHGDAIVRVLCTLHGSREGGGMAGVLLVGNPKVDDLGAGAGLATAIGQSESRVLGAVEGQTASLERLELGVQNLVQTSANLAFAVGLTGVLAAAALLRAWSRAAPNTSPRTPGAREVDAPTPG